MCLRKANAILAAFAPCSYCRYTSIDTIGLLIACMLAMRKTSVIEHCRCYHLINRLAHRAFFHDDGEKRRTVSPLNRQ